MLIITTAALVSLGIILQGWVMSISDVEEQPYKVVMSIDKVEIRYYPPARMLSVLSKTPQEETKQTNNSNFRVLAGYIFGGNSTQQKFAMTTPVHMHQTDTGSRMSFVFPQQTWNATLPEPNDQSIKFHWSEAQYVAAIRFGGFRTPELEFEHQKQLIKTLSTHGIEHMSDFRMLGYDPPFKMVNRRNDLIVSIDPETVPK